MMATQTGWGFLVALYLFLGGTSGALLSISAILSFANPEKYNRTISLCAWLSTAFVAAGTLCLLIDAGMPLSALNLVVSFSNPSSWLTIGAWTIVGTLIASAIFAALMTFSEWMAWIHRVMGALCIVLGLSMTAYTGFLLMATSAVRSWGTPFLILLFIASSLSCGMAVTYAAMRLYEKKKRVRRATRPSKAVLALSLLEAAALNAFLVWSLSDSPETNYSASLLIYADYWPLFWGLVVLCGLVVPVFSSLRFLIFRKESTSTVVLSTACSLLAGIALRTLVLKIGVYAPILF